MLLVASETMYTVIIIFNIITPLPRTLSMFQRMSVISVVVIALKTLNGSTNP